MGSCCGGKRTFTTTGTRTTSYTVTYDDGSTRTYLTELEARREVRTAGGGTITRETTAV